MLLEFLIVDVFFINFDPLAHLFLQPLACITEIQLQGRGGDGLYITDTGGMGLKLTGMGGDGFGSYGYGVGRVWKQWGWAGIRFDICPVQFFSAQNVDYLRQHLIDG